jgi:thiol-disulfide isomerase/thioredoxin
MKRIFQAMVLAAALVVGGVAAESAPPAAAAVAMEKQVAEMAAGPHVTIIHFWAPWCPNCTAEMDPATGWKKFIEANPNVKFVFLNIWHRDQNPASKLAAAGLGAQANLTLLTHPNASSKAADKMTRFLDLPVTWIPTTWVFRDGRMRYALNYGEVRFDMLQTMVEDTRDKAKWAH